MGFCEKWRSWIRTCISGSASVLVNGCPTAEFPLQRGLKQGDPLAPFLFLVVAKGLSGLVSKAVSGGHFKGFAFGEEEVVISHLQYADDSLIVGEATEQNVWVMKAILRCFELVSGLKVNFQESNIIDLNVEEQFMEAATLFLNCKICDVPFTYLGIPLGANPRRSESWQPMVDKLRRRLSSWKRKNLSLGGRIVMINSVLTNLPIYFLSFMKAPKKVIKEMISIQRNFL